MFGSIGRCNRMMKAEAERVILQLCHHWRRCRGYSLVPSDKLSFPDFYSWLDSYYSIYLRFETTVSVKDDVKHWFDVAFDRINHHK
uniref:Uncharacterized protein n=1 Tax=Rhodopseudomonas palustris (strain BisA53) TaxID=316055 RepID=Q07SQ4_RHOP5